MHTKKMSRMSGRRMGSQRILRQAVSALLSVGFATSGLAAPADGVVRAGSAQISAQGNTTSINQGSQRAIIDWRGFSISKDELVQFLQPSASSATLNRVTGDQLSLILGQLSANGQVVLINPNGIIFGAGSKINVGSLIASTSNLSNENFMQGHLIFDQPGKPGAGVINAGSITAVEGGLVALVAPYVRNDGLIQARLGKVMLGAADTFTIDLYGDGLINLVLSDTSLNQLHDVQGQPIKSLITQAGKIDVGAGQAVLVTAQAAKGVLDDLINMSGTILADSAVEQGGHILLLAKGGNVDVSGTLSAQGTSGGQIEVLGDQVHLASTAQLNANGSNAGGTLHVGGAYQGSGDTYRAQNTQVDSGAILNASATSLGNGGEVIVWSDGTTSYAGSILARGGILGGDGGKVEVSGKGTLAFDGLVDAGASKGNAGSLLLDPATMNIGFTEAFLISYALQKGASTTVSATDDINVNSAIDGRGRYAGGGLTLSAGNDININQYIATNKGAINLFAAVGTVNVAPSAVVFAGTAPITVRSGGTLSNALYLTSSTLSLTSTAGSVNIDTAIGSGVGNLVINAFGDVDIEQPIVSLSDGNSVTVQAGQDIIVNGQIEGRPAFGSNPNGAVNMIAGQNIDLNKSILAHSIALTASAGVINAPTMTANTVVLDGNDIPHGEGLFAGNGPISVTSGGALSSGIYVTTGPVNIRSTGSDVTIDTKLAEILGNVAIQAAGDVNIEQEIANIRSGHNLAITAGHDINMDTQIDALNGATHTQLVPVPGGSVTFTAGGDVNLNRDLATFNGPVNITATTGTLNIAPDVDPNHLTYRIQTVSAPINVTTGGDLSTGGTPVPIPLTLTCPTCTTPELKEAYILDQLKPYVAFSTTGKLSLTSTGGTVIVDTPIPDTTGEIKITAADAILIKQKLLSNNQPITLVAGTGGITVDVQNDGYGIHADPFPSIYPGSANLTLQAAGDITVKDIATGGKLTIDTGGKLLGGLASSTPRTPSEVSLNTVGDIGDISNPAVPIPFWVGNSSKVSATSSTGSIAIYTDFTGQLAIDAVLGNVYTGGFNSANTFIHAGNDINLTSIFSFVNSANIVLVAGHDANLHEFYNINSLAVTAGNNVNFDSGYLNTVDPSTATLWFNGGNLTVTSTGGDINFNDYSAIHLGGNASLTLDAENSVTLRVLETLGPVSITAQTGDITLVNDIGPTIFNPPDDPNIPNDNTHLPKDDVPLFDPLHTGPASLMLSAGSNIDMQGARAGMISVTAGGALTLTREILPSTANQLTIIAASASGGGSTPCAPCNLVNISNFGTTALGSQVQLNFDMGSLPSISPGPAVAQPGLPSALTALAAQAPNLSGDSAGGVPGATGGSTTDSENASLNVAGNGGLSEIIPEDGSTDADGSTILVFEGGRGAAQSLDVGQGGGNADADDVLGGNCGKGKSKASCK